MLFEVSIQATERAEFVELVEDQLDRRAGLLVRVEDDFAGRQLEIPARNRGHQFAAFGLVAFASFESALHGEQLDLGHGPL